MNWPDQPGGFRSAPDRTLNVVRRAVEHASAHSSRRQSLLEPSGLALPPAAERAFHIAELASNSRGVPFSPLENLFCIAKIATHPIEKQGKFMSYVLYKTSPKKHRSALPFSHAVRFDIRSATLNHLLKRALLLGD
ncbi:hypothetical protein [Burkholderia sp. JP2-270]|uniref:hypothetical protein n=1 Tax=Burkholderia sp. JP2-270 TaxID=2217913 RepID=UPI0013A6A8A3|nr:hypothetical protein [Burkholderia sp. JP2-270]